MLPLFILSIEDVQERSFYEELFMRYEKDMYQTAFSVVHNRQDAEDAVQKVFLKLIESRFIDRAQLDKDAKIKGYLCVCAKNKAISILRDQNRIDRTDFDSISETIGYEPSLPEEADLAWALSKLPDQDKSIVIAFYYYRMRVSEIARAEGLSNEAVRQRLVRARARLKKILEEKGTTD